MSDDTADLQARLRKKRVDAPFWSDPILTEAADALAVQATRITELEAEGRRLLAEVNDLADSGAQARAQITAALADLNTYSENEFREIQHARVIRVRAILSDRRGEAGDGPITTGDPAPLGSHPEAERATQEERDQIADRLRRLADDHDQQTVYFLSYDADFLREVAERISPSAPVPVVVPEFVDPTSCERHVHSVLTRCANGLTLSDYLLRPRSAAEYEADQNR